MQAGNEVTIDVSAKFVDRGGPFLNIQNSSNVIIKVGTDCSERDISYLCGIFDELAARNVKCASITIIPQLKHQQYTEQEDKECLYRCAHVIGVVGALGVTNKSICDLTSIENVPGSIFEYICQGIKSVVESHLRKNKMENVIGELGIICSSGQPYFSPQAEQIWYTAIKKILPSTTFTINGKAQGDPEVRLDDQWINQLTNEDRSRVCFWPSTVIRSSKNQHTQKSMPHASLLLAEEDSYVTPASNESFDSAIIATMNHQASIDNDIYSGLPVHLLKLSKETGCIITHPSQAAGYPPQASIKFNDSENPLSDEELQEFISKRTPELSPPQQQQEQHQPWVQSSAAAAAAVSPQQPPQQLQVQQQQQKAKITATTATSTTVPEESVKRPKWQQKQKQQHPPQQQEQVQQQQQPHNPTGKKNY